MRETKSWTDQREKYHIQLFYSLFAIIFPGDSKDKSAAAMLVDGTYSEANEKYFVIVHQLWRP